MITLSGATDKLQVVTDAAADLECEASWAHVNGSTITYDGLPRASITTAATTDLVTAPGASQQRFILGAGLFNAHASTQVNVTVQRTDGTNTVNVAGATALLLPGESLRCDASGYWTHYDANGAAYPAVGNAASQAEMEGGTALDRFVTPGRMQYHPGVCKAWVKAGVTANILASWNITSLTDTGTGVMGITIATDFSSTDYCVQVSVEATATTWGVANTREPHIRNATLAAGSLSVDCVDNTATTSLVKDPQTWHVSMFGDQ